MEAGKLRHLITIQSRSVTPDTFGEPAHTWTPLHTNIPASIEMLSARELVSAGAVYPDATHRVRLRYLTGVDNKARVVFGARIFDIRVVNNPDERGIELEMLCSEGASAG